MAFDSEELKRALTPAHYGDVLLPVGVVGLLLLMLIPLPPFMLDLFLSFSITLAMLILLVTMNSGRPAEFSVFPTVWCQCPLKFGCQHPPTKIGILQ